MNGTADAALRLPTSHEMMSLESASIAVQVQVSPAPSTLSAIFSVTFLFFAYVTEPDFVDLEPGAT